jgi:hypothetical protein
MEFSLTREEPPMAEEVIIKEARERMRRGENGVTHARGDRGRRAIEVTV